MSKREFTGLEIAVIGLSGRFNGCKNINDYWKILSEGIETIKVYDNDELDEIGVPKEVYNNPKYVKANGTLLDKECFDAEFWDYTPFEADVMDVQLRVFQESVWEALESAGYAPNEINEKVGLYASASNNSIWQALMQLNKNNSIGEIATSSLADRDYLCSRIAYRLNLKGPAVFIQTACSSSLVAVHEACRALLTGDCQIAIAGGVSASLFKVGGYMYEENMISSSDGHCRAFDSLADGCVGGEGAGVVVLKRYKKALEDGDQIHAIIKGTAINNDGNEKIGFTAPSIQGQANVINKAMKMANLTPDSISYIETHGTGTKLGDSIELKALNECFEKQNGEKITLGSVKTNIGHLDVAAGISGLIKVVLMLKHKKIPQTIHFKSFNPSLDFAEKKFTINNKCIDWESKTPLRAGISSFGIGGTNAHVIVEEPVSFGDEVRNIAPNSEIITLSAKKTEKLEELRINLLNYIKNNPSVNLSDLAYTLNTGRAKFDHRLAVIAQTLDEAYEKLSGAGFSDKSLNKKMSISYVFIFGGQGTQYLLMTKSLYDNCALYKKNVDECFSILEKNFNIDLKRIIFSTENESLIDETLYTQLSLFIVHYSYAKFLMDFDIQPAALLGHSIGEYVAATLSGVFGLEDAIKIIYKRGSLMQKTDRGAMCAVFTSEASLRNILPGNLEISVINGPNFCVVSGRPDDIKAFTEVLEKDRIIFKILNVKFAFHSFLMDNILQEYEEFLNQFAFELPKIPIISNITGRFVDVKMDQKYWKEHLRSTVNFSKGVETLLDAKYNRIVDFGFGKQLYNIAGQLKSENEICVFNAIKGQNQKNNDFDIFLDVLKQIWYNGGKPDFNKLYTSEKRYRIQLPTYPFERIRFPISFDYRSFLNRGVEGKSNSYEVEGMLYEPYWEKGDKNEISDLEILGEESNALLICDNLTKEDFLYKQIKSKFKNIIIVRNDDFFRKEENLVFYLNVGSEEQYGFLIEELTNSNININNIVHCLNVNPEDVVYSNIDSTLSKGYLSISFLVKAIEKFSKRNKIKLNVLTTDVAKINSADFINPLKSTIIGTLKIVSVEYRFINCKIVDITTCDFGNSKDMELLESEILSGESFSYVALRNSEKWIPKIRKYKKETNTRTIADNTDGCYIVAGGFGGMGFTLAIDLAETKKKNVVIIHRSAFPKEEDWDTVLNNSEGNEDTKEKIRHIKRIRDVGGAIKLLRADVSDIDHMKEVISSIHNNYKNIAGIIWAAGVVDHGGILQKRSKKDLIEYIKSKVHGLLILESLVDFSKIGYLSLFSSAGNVFYKEKGGQIAYNVANEFMESYAGYVENKYKIRAFTINWNDWKDVGMSFKVASGRNKEMDRESINESLSDAIYPNEGVSIFKKCFKSTGNIFHVSRVDLLKLNNNASKEVKVNKFRRPDISSEYIKPQSSIDRSLETIFIDTFGIEKIGLDDDFFELGGDSLKAIQIINIVESNYKIRIPLEEFFANPTISGISNYIKAKGQGIILANEDKSTSPKRNAFPILPPQKRMFLINQMDPNATDYNQVSIFKIKNLKVEKLKNAFLDLIERHQGLRTSFKSDVEGQIIQEISEKVDFELEEFNLNEFEGLEKIQKVFERPFDLSKSPLFRAAIVNGESGTNYLIVDTHHIITDGKSNEIFFNDLLTLYNGNVLKPLEKNYTDYVEHFYSENITQELKQEEEYWLNKFKGEIPSLGLISDTMVASKTSSEGASFKFEVDSELSREVLDMTKKEGVTLFIFCFSIYNILISKLTNQEDIVIGTPFLGRDKVGYENVIGMFVQTLALRNNVKADYKFKHFLKEIKKSILKDFDNRKYPLEELISKLSVDRAKNKNPLFEIIFSGDEAFFNKQSGLRGHSSNDSIELVEDFNSKVPFDLMFRYSQQNGGLSFCFDYNKNLFDEGSIKRYSEYYKKILEQIIKCYKNKDEDYQISDIEILSDRERLQILNEFNNNKTDYPRDKAIHQLFNDQVRISPNRIALEDQNVSLSYKMLDEQSSKVANCLRKRNVRTNELVGIIANRSIEMIVGILGILKSGGAYVPIDPEYPLDRIKYLISECGIDLLLTTRETDIDSSIKGEKILLDEDEIHNISCDFEFDDSSLGNFAYIMFTSGSSGYPKGVGINHRSVLRLVKNTNYVPMMSTHRILQTGAPVFDATTFEIWTALLNGGRLFVSDNNVITNAYLLEDYILKKSITTLWLTSSLFNQLVDINESIFDKLSYLLVGGDALSYKHITKTRNRNKKLVLINGYGPTENTTFSTTFEISKTYDKNIPIGKPINNSTAYIFDSSNKLQPVGVSGELVVGGDGVAVGYLNNPELTATKFIKNSFNDGEILYRTGDLARWLPDGNIEFIGRIDHQVKIRGFRIELGEIESVLLKHDNIKECIVLAHEENGDKLLCAYIVCDTDISLESLRSYLVELLPEYMVPSFFVKMQSFPLNTNGKVDRKLLPAPVIQSSCKYEAPSNEIEQELVKIWSEVLSKGEKEISINDDFFELGGHSLRITLLLSKIHKQFNVKFTFADAYTNSVLYEQGKLIKKLKRNTFININHAEKREYYPLTKTQRGIYIYQKLYPNSSNYNIQLYFPLSNDFDIKRLMHDFKTLVSRHDALRTTIIEPNNKPYQKIYNDPDFEIPIYESSLLDYKEAISPVLMPFNLNETPLFRACVLAIKGKQPILIVNLHHIICDGFSISVLYKDFEEIVHEKICSPLRYQFKDIAVWQSEDSKFKKNSEAHKNYWLRKFEDGAPILNLPLDQSRGLDENIEAEQLSFKLSDEETKIIKEIAINQQTSVYTVILSVFYIWLKKLTGDEDIVIGTPISGRYHENFNKVCGMFVNTLALRNYPGGKKLFKEFLNEVNSNVLDDFENQWFSFDELVSAVCKERVIGRNPIFDVFYTFDGENTNDVDGNSLMKDVFDEDDSPLVKFDLFLSATLKGKGIEIAIDYKKALFKNTSMEYYVSILRNVISSIIKNQNVPIDEMARVDSGKINKEIVIDLQEDF